MIGISVGNIDMFILMFWQQLKDCVAQKWLIDINYESHCYQCKFCKSQLNPEHCLYCDIPRKYCVA